MHPSRQALLIAKQQELTSLAHDIPNATQVLALKQQVERLFNLVAHVIFLVTDEAPLVNVAPNPPPNPVPPQNPTTTTPVYPPGYHVTPGYQQRLVPPAITQPVNVGPATSPVPEIPPSDKMNVVITPQGTTVIPPIGGAPVNLPPNTPVDLSEIMAPAVPPPAPPGVMNVVLPRGGVMTPEVSQGLPGSSPVSPDGVIPPQG